MHFLITAGNTQTPVDRVRCITNIFSGRTGGGIAAATAERGHHVTFLTSHPEALGSCSPAARRRLDVRTYRTFDELDQLMEQAFAASEFDVVIHAAAVSDYRLASVFSLQTLPGERPRLVDAAAGKVKSSHDELWLRLTPTPKLVDKIRSAWGFEGVLVKFKLEVDVAQDELLAIAEASRQHSDADLMVANTLEGMRDWALVGSAAGYERVSRAELSSQLTARCEQLASANDNVFVRPAPFSHSVGAIDACDTPPASRQIAT
jgi:phosphopantothenate-cysteine ligase/phosphopantothenoylcysteine decarboxylase/phosphopantothenate--cysteine ligase